MEKVYTKSELVQMIEDLKTEERVYTENFCELNLPYENEQRRRDCAMIIDALNRVLEALDEINPD